MKRRPSFFVALEGNSWLLARVCGDQVELREVQQDAESPQQETDALVITMKELGYAGQGVCLGLPSEMVLAAPIDCVNLPRKKRREAMVYMLEERLPLEAEKLTAEFLPAIGGKALGLAVDTNNAASVLLKLDGAGIEVVSICPTALLALADFCNKQTSVGDYALLATNSHVDVFRLVDHQPCIWYTAPAQAVKLVQYLKADMLSCPPQADRPIGHLIGQLSPELVEPLENQAGLAVKLESQEPVVAAAARSAAAVLAGKGKVGVDFRRDGLASPHAWKQLAQPLIATAGLLMLSLAVLTVIFIWRGIAFAGITKDLRRQQAVEYSRLWPNTQIPPNVRSRLRSEFARLAGASGSGMELPVQPPALETLRQVISAVPPGVPMRILNVRISPTETTLEGQAKSHSDAEFYAQALKRIGLVVVPPRSENLAHGGVGFTVTAKLASAVAGKAGKGIKP